MGSAVKVLVVEDEAVVIESVKRILEPEGFTVDASLSAEEATQKLQTHEYDIILIDIVLPGISGLQLTELLRRSHPEAIAITFSGLATRENVVESLHSGAFDFIPKPFSFEELLGAVQRAATFCRSRQGRPPAGETWAGYHFLGEHTWVTFDPDGAAVIGVDESFAEVFAAAESIEYPAAFEEIEQGHACARVTTRDGLVHVVWCAAGGVVVESNAGLGQGRSAPASTGDTYNGFWLLRVWPQHREADIANLKTQSQR